MATKSVAEKMYLKPGMSIGFFNAPDNIIDLLGGLPEEVNLQKPSEGQNLDIVLGFIENREMMEKELDFLRNSITSDGALWIAYHKGSSSVDTDINRDDIHNYAVSLDLKGVAMVSIDKNWSGFRFKKV